MFTPNATASKSKTVGFINIKVGGKSVPVTVSVTDSQLFEALVSDPTLFARIVNKGEVTVKSNERAPSTIDWNSL